MFCYRREHGHYSSQEGAEVSRRLLSQASRRRLLIKFFRENQSPLRSNESGKCFIMLSTRKALCENFLELHEAAPASEKTTGEQVTKAQKVKRNESERNLVGYRVAIKSHTISISLGSGFAGSNSRSTLVVSIHLSSFGRAERKSDYVDRSKVA